VVPNVLENVRRLETFRTFEATWLNEIAAQETFNVAAATPEDARVAAIVTIHLLSGAPLGQ
jgi:hypothetical protein